jgi:hypothetical protein
MRRGKINHRAYEDFHVQEIDFCGFGRVIAVGDLCSSWSANQLGNQPANFCATAETRLRRSSSGLRGSGSSTGVCTGTNLPSARGARVRAALARSRVCAAGSSCTIIWVTLRMDQGGCANEKGCKFSWVQEKVSHIFYKADQKSNQDHGISWVTFGVAEIIPMVTHREMLFARFGAQVHFVPCWR